MGFMYKMFSDVQGNPSTNRFISSFVVIFPLLVWAFTVYKAGAWQPIPEELLILIGGGLTSKVVQRGLEQKDTSDKAVEKVKDAMKAYLEKCEKNVN